MSGKEDLKDGLKSKRQVKKFRLSLIRGSAMNYCMIPRRLISGLTLSLDVVQHLGNPPAKQFKP
jgi:hypothetical protein